MEVGELMADVYNYITSTGTITTSTDVIQTDVQDEFLNALGLDLNLNPNTPQGLLITGETLSRIAVADNNAALANQINPNLAGGVFLDAILALTGVQRSPSTPSTVLCTITGVEGTLIPAGSQASETGSGNQNIFETVNAVTIPVGSILSNVAFQSVVDGPISAAANTLTKIVSNILGWETVTNPLAATLGVLTQSDTAARTLRQLTLASQGSSLAQAITAALYEVPGVTSLTFRENVANTTQVIDGITMVAHSLYACVNGGTNTAVAEAITAKKSGGCNYNNGASAFPLSVALTEPFSGQLLTVLFDRPDIINVQVQATVSAATSVQNPTTAVTDSIQAYAAGQIAGEPGLVVGASVSCFELAGAVTMQTPGIFVHNMQTKTGVGSYSNAEIPVALWQIAVVDSITVIIV